MEAQSRFLQFQADLPRPIRRAIWIGARAGIILGYVGLIWCGIYGAALCVATNDPRYSFITGIALAAIVFITISPDESSEDDETTQPLTPTT